MIPRRPGDSRLSLFLVCALAAFGCRSAAEVILDLPEPRPDPESTAVDSRASSVLRPETFPTGGTWVDTITVRPEIESVVAESALSLLPRHSSGQIDWGAALEDGTIAPRAEPPGQRPVGPPAPFGYDFYFGEVETSFPHTTHSAWLSCGSCHPAVYRRREGTKTTMAMMQDGESCGLCHGGVAFKADACERCHPDLQLPAGRIQPSLEVDLVIPRDSASGTTADDFPPSIFPHWTHRVRYRCTACHPSPFVMRAGGTSITMSDMQRGETCGACHDGRTAFGIMECGLCHRPVPEPIVLPDPADTG